jgi:hypothetical protein
MTPGVAEELISMVLGTEIGEKPAPVGPAGVTLHYRRRPALGRQGQSARYYIEASNISR